HLSPFVQARERLHEDLVPVERDAGVRDPSAVGREERCAFLRGRSDHHPAPYEIRWEAPAHRRPRVEEPEIAALSAGEHASVGRPRADAHVWFVATPYRTWRAIGSVDPRGEHGGIGHASDAWNAERERTAVRHPHRRVVAASDEGEPRRR